ncbi:MAG: aminodeoxychorismate/anthranilate synthase component II [Succinivibrionaceae bacterium]|nr:aminodeoxychorismate/anthranilate synthase component II [Succinivibrionaceae bacterium]
MAAQIIFIDNFDSFTYNLVDELRILGLGVTVYRNDADTDFIIHRAEEIRDQGDEVALLLSPGPSRPCDAGNLLPIIRRAMGWFPMLGICLGHQALGEALGGRVVRAPEIVHGKSWLINHQGQACFAGLPSPLRAARYHSLIVEGLPPKVETIAEVNGMCMALYAREQRALGFQFHPESIMTTEGRRLIAQALSTLGLTV